MRIHEFHKCQKCNEFHSVDYGMFVKPWVNIWAQLRVQSNEICHVNGLIVYSPAVMIHEYSNARNDSEVQLLDRQYDHQKQYVISGQVSSVENETPCSEVYSFEYYRCICKSIGLNEKICMVELKSRSGFDDSATDFFCQ